MALQVAKPGRCNNWNSIILKIKLLEQQSLSLESFFLFNNALELAILLSYWKCLAHTSRYNDYNPKHNGSLMHRFFWKAKCQKIWIEEKYFVGWNIFMWNWADRAALRGASLPLTDMSPLQWFNTLQIVNRVPNWWVNTTWNSSKQDYMSHIIYENTFGILFLGTYST